MINDDAKKRKLLRDVLEREGYRDMEEIARLHNVSVKTAYAWLGEIREKIMNELDRGSLSMTEVRKAIPKKLLDQWTEATKIQTIPVMPPSPPAPSPSPSPSSNVKVTLDGDYVNIRIPSQMFLRLFLEKLGPRGR